MSTTPLLRMKTTTAQAEAATGSYSSAALLVNIPNSAKAAAQITFKNLGTAGTWYISYGGVSPTTTVYDQKLTPGEPFTEDEPPFGDVYALQVGANGKLSYYLSYAT